MGDIFDNLFSVIPIVLAILWDLRRASKKKTGTKAAQPQSRAASAAAPAKPINVRSRLSEQFRSIEARATKAIRNEVSQPQPRDEDVQYDKLEPRPINVPDAAPAPFQGRAIAG